MKYYFLLSTSLQLYFYSAKIRLSVSCNVRSRKIIYICDVFIKNLK